MLPSSAYDVPLPSRPGWALLVAAIFLLWGRPASAQVPPQVYDDAKAIIEELIEKDVAETVVPNIACQAPVTLVYYPTTLQRVFDRQFGSLRPAITTDTANLAGSFVYYALSDGQGHPLSDALGGFLRSETHAGIEGMTRDATCSQKVRTAGGPLYYGIHQITLLERGCSSFPDSLPCAFGHATRDFALGDNQAGEQDLRRALSIVIASRLGTIAGFDLHAEIEAIDAALLKFLRNPADPANALATSVPAGPLRDQLAAQGALLARVGAQWQLATNGGNAAIVPLAFISFLAVAEDPGSLCGQSGGSCAVLKTFLKDEASDIRHFIEASGKHDIESIAVEALRSAFAILARDPDCKATPSSPPTQSEDLKAFVLKTQRNVTPETSDASTGAPGPAVVDAAKVAGSAAEPPECGRQILIDRYGRFLASLASYTIQAAVAGAPSTEARAAFRSAAVDVLETDGPQTGFQRAGWSNVLVPKPALRFSWSPGYVNETTHDGVRYVASLDWPTIRIPIRYTDQTYLAVNLSLLDLIGPFSESALRKQGDYMDSELQWYEFFDPRVEFVIGVPALTSHVALVGAVSYRGAAVAKLGADGSTHKYFSPLQTLFDGAFPADYTGGRGAYYGQFVETSLGVKYLP